MNDDRPVLIDFFCKAGGASAGYHRAGFRVIGVDHEPQPNYPYAFLQCDAIEEFDALVEAYRPAAVVGSPPCQAHSRLRTRTQRSYPDFIAPFRAKCLASGLPYVIENVEGAPLINPVVMCGSMVGRPRVDGLLFKRHRLFELNFQCPTPPDDCRGELTINVHSGGGYRERRGPNGERIGHGNKASAVEAAVLLGIDWMTGDEMNEAIPPSYTKHIGGRIREHLSRERAA